MPKARQVQNNFVEQFACNVHCLSFCHARQTAGWQDKHNLLTRSICYSYNSKRKDDPNMFTFLIIINNTIQKPQRQRESERERERERERQKERQRQREREGERERERDREREGARGGGRNRESEREREREREREGRERERKR